MSYRILYFGKFESDHSTENYVAYALRQLGQEVTTVSHTRYSDRSEVLDVIKTKKPDVVLFSKAVVPHTEAILSLCNSLNMLTVCWHWDLYFNCMGRETDPWPQLKSDLLFTTDGGHDTEFRNQGYNHQLLRQGIHYPEAIKQPTDFKYAVGFIGHGESRLQEGRSELIKELSNVYGDSFSHVESTRGLNLNRWLSEVKVVVGDCYPTKKGRYWSNRVYEVLGRGGFLLHPEVEGLDSEFTKKRHLDVYPRGNYPELHSQVSYYLQNEDIRESIRSEGHLYCRDNYTYETRCQTLLSHIGAAKCH